MANVKFVGRFKDHINVKPVLTEHLREVELKFDSPVAQIDLTFSLTHDMEVKNLFFDRRLHILPILMKFDDRSSLTMPLDKIDEGRIVEWFDDRVVDFVQIMKELHQNNYYLKGHLVTDPIAGVHMPKYAAKPRLKQMVRSTTSSAMRPDANSRSSGRPQVRNRSALPFRDDESESAQTLFVLKGWGTKMVRCHRSSRNCWQWPIRQERELI